MYVQFDSSKMHVQVICGSLEEYKPSKNMKVVQEKVSKLQGELRKFKSEVVEPQLIEIQQLIDKENEKQQKKQKKKVEESNKT